MTITQGAEAYLEAIYVLHGEGEEVIGARLADYLGVARPTVTQMMQRLSANGLVEMAEGKELRLTAEGVTAAEAIVRRHRLLERWLSDQLGLDWAQAHKEAARLEHSLSPLVEERLAEALGNPTTCPHGNIIPGSGATLEAGAIPLAKAKPGDRLEIQRIVELAEEDLDLLIFLQSSGLVPGAMVEMLAVNAYARDLQVQVVSKGLVALHADVARRLMAVPRPH